MRSPNLSRHRGESAPNLTALVDVVMVILIFLMLAGSIGGKTTFLKAKTAQHAINSRPDNALDDLDVMITPTSDGGYIIHAGKIVTRDADVLTKELAGEFRDFKAAGIDANAVHVVLRPTREVRYDQVIKIYQSAMQAGFRQIMFART